MRIECKNCGGTHPIWDCQRPKVKPAERRINAVIDTFEDIKPGPVIPSKAKRGRPKTDFNKQEYNRLYMRDLRTIKQIGLGITVKQYREKLK